jgi:hypothetical protein
VPSTGISKVWAFMKPAYIEPEVPHENRGLSGFKKEWSELTEKDREQIRIGVENDTLTY